MTMEGYKEGNDHGNEFGGETGAEPTAFQDVSDPETTTITPASTSALEHGSGTEYSDPETPKTDTAAAFEQARDEYQRNPNAPGAYSKMIGAYGADWQARVAASDAAANERWQQSHDNYIKYATEWVAEQTANAEAYIKKYGGGE